MIPILVLVLIGQVSPLDRGIAYLSIEVPRWRTEHTCRSCHHHGDGARALLEGRAAGLKVSEEALAEAMAWLAQPSDWDKNETDGPFTDKRLAQLQFAGALSSAWRERVITDRVGWNTVVERLLADQAGDGSWQVGQTGILGTPVTRGKALATALAIEALSETDLPPVAASVTKAKRWLAARRIESTLDAASSIRVGDLDGPGLALLIRGQSNSGGWGPYPTSPPEVFDTAVVLWALSKHRADPRVRLLIEKGRNYLVSNQTEDGSWTETTRPSGSESLAQRVSTTAWAVIALISIQVIK